MSFFEKRAEFLRKPTQSEQPGYEARPGSADGEGVLFERLAAGLAFLRCVREQLTFLLSSNDTAGGDRFDDLVLTWQDEDKGRKRGATGFDGASTTLPSETGNEDRPSLRSLLVQQKYKTSPKKKTILFDHLTKKSEDFCIRNFHDSYMKIRDSLNGGNYALVLYTNSTLGVEIEHMFIAEDSESSPWMKLLESGGCVYKLNPADEDVKHTLEKGDEQFIHNFYLFCGQSDNESMEGKICSELQQILAADESCSRTMCEALCRSLREWMLVERRKFLTSSWESWLNIVYRYVNKEVTTCNSLITKKIKYCNVETLQLYIEGCNPAWIRPPGREATALTAAKLHQIIRDEKHVMVSVARLSELEKKILCCWGPFYRWLLIVDDYDGDKSSYEILDCLRKLSEQNRRLVIVADKGDDSFPDTCQSDDILEESWAELLKVKIMLNSEQYSCLLGDLCGTKALKAILDGRPEALVALSHLSGPVRMGQDLDALPENHIPRHLTSRIRVGQEFFSTLGDNELCIMNEISYKHLKNKTVLKNPVKFEELENYLSLSDPVWPLFVVTSIIDHSAVQMIGSKYVDVRVYTLSYADDEWLYIEEQSKNLLQVVDGFSNQVIVEGKPGVGKSTVLKDMARQLKEKTPEWWILRIDLLTYTEEFDRYESGFKAGEDILARVVYNEKNLAVLECALLQHCLQEYPRIVCLVDGFDEVCPDFADKCLEALQKWTPRRGKLVVTTRPSVTGQLEAALGVLSHSLPAFSEDQLDEFHSRTLSDMGVTDTVRDLLKIPLFSRMYAESLESGDVVEDIVSLYEAFFERKFRRLYEEKWGDNLSKPGKKRKFQKDRMEQQKQLGFLAVSYLIPSIKVPHCLQKSTMDRDDLMKAGVIYQFTDDKPVFIHRTFAEHFLAKWCFSDAADGLHAIVYRRAISDSSLEFFVESFDRIASGGRPLLTAVLNGCETEVKTLLEKGEDPTEGDKWGRSSLHLAAAYSRDSTILRLLVESLKATEASRESRSASWETKGKQGWYLNRKWRTTKSVRVVTDSQWSVASRAPGPSVIGPSHYVEVTAVLGAEDGLLHWTPLRYAAERQHWSLVPALLEAGAQLCHLGDFQRGLHNPEELWRVFKENGYKALFDHIASKDKSRWSLQMLEHLCKNQKCLEIKVGVSIICAEMSVEQYTKIGVEASENANSMVLKLLARKCMDLMRTVETSALDLRQSCSRSSQLEEHRQMPLDEAGRGRSLFHTMETARAVVRVLNAFGETLLPDAVQRGDVERVLQLIKAGADVNIKDKEGMSAIHYAAACDSVECIICLQTANADVNVKDKNGQTPLHLAAVMGRSQSVRILLDAGADALAPNSEYCTPLHTAAQAGNAECVRLLAEASTTLEFKALTGLTAMHLAARGGEAECVKLLLDAGALSSPADDKLATPLHYAALGGNAECVRLLLQYKADVAARDVCGGNALHWAAYSGNPDCVRLLLEAGADVQGKGGEGRTPLHYAALAGSPACIRQLLEKGADVNKRNNYDVTPLHYAAYSGNAECAKLLLDAGADVLALGSLCQTPLHVAASKKNVVCFILLLYSAWLRYQTNQ